MFCLITAVIVIFHCSNNTLWACCLSRSELLGICDNVKSLSEALCIYNSSCRSTLIITQWTVLWATWSSPWSMMWLETRSTFDCCLGTLDTRSWLFPDEKKYCFDVLNSVSLILLLQMLLKYLRRYKSKLLIYSIVKL